MRYLWSATILLFALAGCRSANDDTAPRLLLIDCRNQKIHSLSGQEITDGDPLAPSFIPASEMPDAAQ